MMAGPAERPIVFLDVDGTLIPFRNRPARTHARATDDSGNPLLDRLDPGDGRGLLALGCELVWATTWMAEANDVVAPRIWLPRLPVVEFPDDETEHGLHWKTTTLTRWAGGRPFIWLDDEIADTDRTWVHRHYPAPALLHRVDSLTGLTEADFTLIHHWLGTVS